MVNFSWLKKQAGDKKSEQIILSKIKKWHVNSYKGKFLKTKDLFVIKLRNYQICLRKCSAYSSMDTYADIFGQKLHFLLPEFSGSDAEVIIDAGACEGYYTLKIKEDNPFCKIIAVEPNILAYNQLKRNISLNNLKNVISVNKALSGKKGKMHFEFTEVVNSVGGSDIRILERDWLKEKMVNQKVVNSITLEDLFKTYKVEKVDILKLDIQGKELEVIRSGENLLKKVKKIVVEWHSNIIRREIKKFLNKFGFSLVLENEFGPSFGENKYLGDLYFINKNKNNIA